MVFILFAFTAAFAVRVCVTGRGIRTLTYVVILLALMCFEPSGERVKVAPSAVFLAFTGAALLVQRKDAAGFFCALTVGAICVVAAADPGAGFAAGRWGYLCAALLSAVVCEPRSAGTVFALGCILGNTYSVFRDFQIVFREDLFSVRIVYVAVFWTLASMFFQTVLSLSPEKHEFTELKETRRLKA